MIHQNRSLKFLIVMVVIFGLLTNVIPALADCTVVTNAAGGGDWNCTGTTIGVVNGTPGNDYIVNHGTISGYLWTGGFRSLSNQVDTIINNGIAGDGEINPETGDDDDGLWGAAGNDTIINNGTIYGGGAGSMFGDGLLAYVVDYDILINNGIAYGDIMGDFQTRGHDTITINGYVEGSVYGDVALAWERYSPVQFVGQGGNDLIILQNNAEITQWIDGNPGTDTLRFAFTTNSQSEYNALSSAISSASPANGSLIFRNKLLRWRNMEILQNNITLVTGEPTATYTATNTFTPSHTPTNLPTNTPTFTLTPSNTPVNPTATYTPTDVPTNTPSFTPTHTPTNTPTNTPTFTPSPTPASSGTIVAQINLASDDVNEDGTTYIPGYLGVWFGNGSSGGANSASFAGLRFNNIAIPRGATITSARLEIYSGNGDQWISINMQIGGEASDNSVTFSAGSRPSQRPQTTTRINHSTNLRWFPNTWYVLENVTAVVQEIINRPGWQSGNSLALIMRGTGASWSRKYAWAFEGNPANAPRLVITYNQ